MGYLGANMLIIDYIWDISIFQNSNILVIGIIYIIDKSIKVFFNIIIAFW